MSALVAALDTALAAPGAAAALTTTTTTLSTSSSSSLHGSSSQAALIKALLGALLAASYSPQLCEQVLGAGGAGPLARLLQQCAGAGAACKQLPLVSQSLCWPCCAAPQSVFDGCFASLPNSSTNRRWIGVTVVNAQKQHCADYCTHSLLITHSAAHSTESHADMYSCILIG
jgi:hypothetical protein